MTEINNLETTGLNGGIQQQPVTNTAAPMYVVGPHSAYRTVDELFEGAKQKEAYIARLEQENAALKEEASKASNREQFVQDLERLTTPTTTQPSSDTPEDSESKLKELVNKVLLDKAEASRKEEMRKVAESIFGNEAEQKLEAKASELGMTKDQLMGLSDKAFYALVGIQKQSQTPSGMMSGVQGFYSQQPTEAETFKKEVLESKNDPRKMAELIQRALKDPSLVQNL